MKEKIKLGYIGLGRRGYSMLKHCFGRMPDVEIAWLADLIPEKLEKAAALLAESGVFPKKTTDYREILADPTVDAVAVMTGWNGHIQCSLDSLKAGKYTAVEVGTAYSLDECYELIKAGESTGAQLMMLENCCYGRRELMALRMVREGLFGEIVHCDGAYHHWLPEEDIFRRDENGVIDLTHYRWKEYSDRNREQYPTHAFGPISKILGLNRGNRIIKLSSFASKAAALNRFVADTVEEGNPLRDINFIQGDITDTVITCENGQTVRLTLDTTAPRPFYSREFTVRGTLGMCTETTKKDGFFYLRGMKETCTANEQEFYEKYDHPLYAEYSRMQARGGHGGIDWLVCRAFVESVKRGIPTPIDLYDTVTWMAIGPLSELSIANGGMPVDFPDFTNGRWKNREPAPKCKYGLEEIFDDPSTPIF